jgi:hypothetical protein
LRAGQYGHVVSRGDQGCDQAAADDTGPTGDKNRLALIQSLGEGAGSCGLMRAGRRTAARSRNPEAITPTAATAHCQLHNPWWAGAIPFGSAAHRPSDGINMASTTP